MVPLAVLLIISATLVIACNLQETVKACNLSKGTHYRNYLDRSVLVASHLEESQSMRTIVLVRCEDTTSLHIDDSEGNSFSFAVVLLYFLIEIVASVTSTIVTLLKKAFETFLCL